MVVAVILALLAWSQRLKVAVTDRMRAVFGEHRMHAQPVPPVGYAAMIPAVRTPLPGLYFASMSQVYPWDRGTNFAVELGQDVARAVLKH